MFAALARFSTYHWKLILLLTAVFSAVSYYAFRQLPVEAYPDVTDPMVEVVAVFPGQSAEETERRVSAELERVLAGTPHLKNIRSVSIFGLSLVTLRFSDASTDRENRIHVAERLREATLPDGVEALIGPQATPVGQIYRYTLSGPRTLRELRSIQDWVVERRLRSVPGVADVVTFGGFERQYALRIDPVRLANLDVTVGEVFRAVEATSQNAGGGYVGIGNQEFVVRGLGSLEDPADIGRALVTSRDGIPIRVRDVADVVESSVPRRGSVGRNLEDEVVQGIVLLRRGENPDLVLAALQERVDELNGGILPSDVRLVPFYDRRDLMAETLSTVGHNLLHGAILVVSIALLFLRSASAALIIACVIPLALLTSFLGLRTFGMSANLISLGAIDFGILVENAAVVLEVTLHGMAVMQATGKGPLPLALRRQAIADASASVARPVGFAKLIVIVGLLPLFFLEQVEGRIFAPMAYTYVFALIGARVAATTVVPALAAVLLRREVPSEDPRWFRRLLAAYARALSRARRFRWYVLGAAVAGGGLLASYARPIGTEFLPQLNEGGLYITAVFPSTIALDEASQYVPDIRRKILALPEAQEVLSQLGRPEDATQIEGPNNLELFVKLAPLDSWRPGYRIADLERELRGSLQEIPGVSFNFSQPITDRVFETISGIIGQVVVKVRGDDLEQLTDIAEQVKDRLGSVEGVTDLLLYQAGSVPQMGVRLDRERLAERGLSVAEVQEVIEVALGGKVATEVWEGERRYGVALRLPDAVRQDPEALGRLVVGDAENRVTLAEVAEITPTLGRSAIWRENLSRFVAVKFNVRDRDLGSTVAAAREAVADIELPEGTTLAFGGEFENQQRAMQRLVLVVPLTLLAMLGILYWNFGRWLPALTIMAFLPLAVACGVAGLRAMGENFSVSAAVGCITLLGQVVLAGVLVCTRIDHAAKSGAADPGLAGALLALRSVLLTVCLAALGLVPAALSQGMGSESQRPFAIAIIAGLLATVPAVLLLLPLFYRPPADPGAGGSAEEALSHAPGDAPSKTPAVGPAVAAALALALVLSLPAPAGATEQSSPAPPATPAANQGDPGDRGGAAPPMTLDQLFARWLQGSREVAAWRAELGAARFDVVTARTLPNPELEVSGSLVLSGAPPDGMRNYGASLSVPLPIFGQVGARSEAAQRALDVAETRVAVLLWERAAEIREAAIARAYAHARVENAERTLEELARVQRIVESRGAGGVAPRYDAMRVALLRETLEADAAAARVERETAEASLLGLVGDPLLTQAPVHVDGLSQGSRSTSASTSSKALEDERGLLRVALARRPDLELARRSARAALALAQQHRKDATPTPSLVIGTWLTHAESSVSVLGGVSVPLPLFDRNQGAIGRAEGEARAHRALLEALEARTRAEVQGAVRALRLARQAEARFEESGVLVTSDLLERAWRAYEAGTFSIAEALDAYDAVWKARAEALELRKVVADAETRLARAIALDLR